MKPHKHKRQDWCNCSSSALEPEDSCPIHGQVEYPPRCYLCGQFLKREKYEISQNNQAIICPNR